MHPVDYNVALIEAMLGEIAAYLLSPEVYWPLERHAPAGGPPFPRLSLGGLLLAFDELEAAQAEMSPAQAESALRLRAARADWEKERPAGLARKAAAELHSRLDLWRAYMADLAEQPDAGEAWAGQVAHRVMASRLAPMASGEPGFPALEARLRSLDARLEGVFKRGEFVWDPRLQAVYPPGPYWFLYGRPRPPR